MPYCKILLRWKERDFRFNFQRHQNLAIRSAFCIVGFCKKCWALKVGVAQKVSKWDAELFNPPAFSRYFLPCFGFYRNADLYGEKKWIVHRKLGTIFCLPPLGRGELTDVGHDVQIVLLKGLEWFQRAGPTPSAKEIKSAKMARGMMQNQLRVCEIWHILGNSIKTLLSTVKVSITN